MLKFSFHCTIFICLVWSALLYGSDAACSSGWEEYNGNCYLFFQPATTWGACYSYCNALGGSLLCVNSVTENNYINTKAAAYGGYIWLGYNDAATEGSFVWDRGCSATYQNWLPGQPDGTPMGAEDYVVMFTDGTWLDGLNDRANTYCGCQSVYAPSASPTVSPSAYPTVHPTRLPSANPTRLPTSQPSSQPSRQPSAQPNSRPTSQPSGQPSSWPTAQPTSQPSRQPSGQPTSRPTTQPTSQPSRQPSGQPSSRPTTQPTSQPSRQPSGQPTSQPSRQPTSQPSSQPTSRPSSQPSSRPTRQPSGQPSNQPSAQPSQQPSSHPTSQPSGQPSSKPSDQPTAVPSSQPVSKPTAQPTGMPSSQPSRQPSALPTSQPTGKPSAAPTVQPSTVPSVQPSSVPSAQPSAVPSSQPSSQPSSDPSVQPSSLPSAQPTSVPTAQPSGRPSTQPSSAPSSEPTSQPSSQPSALPSSQPSTQPSTQPSSGPSVQPTGVPTLQPSELPTSQPSVQPSSEPSGQPSQQPSSAPTSKPSSQPSTNPTAVPSSRPTAQPSSLPSAQPSDQPSVSPTSVPSVVPTTQPSSQPTSAPSPKPSPAPTVIPTHAPSAFDASAPLVYITTTAQARTAVNVEQKISLTGVVTAKATCTAAWSVDSANVHLANSTLSPLSVLVADVNAAKAVNLVLAPFTLPVRSTLLFVLTCGKSASATVVTTNGPPIVGKFTVLPASGLELSTQFSFAAKGWVDADLPVTFQFGFVSPTSGAFLVLHSRSMVNATTAMLPAGTFSAQYRVQSVVQAFDVLGASSNASAIVTVAKQTNAAQLQGSILSLLSSSSGDVAATKSAIAVGATALNSVSCADAPSCAVLNRASCATVQNTCGECLAGFIGDVGDSNSACLSPATIQLSASAVRSCLNDRDCNSWEQCDLRAPLSVCALPSKVCPSACSGHGECAFVNVNSHQPVADCKSNVPTCDAVCVCSAGFFGASCNATFATHSAKQSVRDQLISGLSGVSSTETASRESVSSWAAALAELTQDPFELSDDAVVAANALSLSIVTSAQSVSSGVSYTTLFGVLASLDAGATATVTAASRNTSSTGNAVLSAVSHFADLVTSQLVVGEAAVEQIYDNFRTASVRQLAIAGSRMNLTMPQTFAELSGAFAMPSVSIDLGTARDEEITVSLISTAASTYGAQGETFNSNPLRLQVNRNSTAATRVTLVLVNNVAAEYTNATLGFNSTCLGDADRSIHNYTCPLSGELLFHNCTGLSGVMTSYCPVQGPTCSVKDSSGVFVSNSSVCTVATFDARSTTCECVIASAPNRRRLADSLDESGLLDLVTATTFLGNSFVNTFHASGKLTSAAALERVLIVIVMFSTLWAGGLLVIFGCAWRRKVMEKVNDKEQSKLERKVQSAQVSRSPAAVRQYLADYVSETLPSVFSSKPFFSRCYGEVKRHHRYFTLFMAPEGEAGDKERILTAVELLSVQTMLMFLLALLYDVQGPSDDGTCPYKLSQTECTRRRSPFDSSQSYCDWVDSSTSKSFSCTYKDPHFTLQVVIYIGVMVALLVALISYPVDRLFELLGAPEADELKLANDPGLVQRAARRASNVARRVSLVASNLATAAQTTTRKILAGSVTRKIPESTEAAHALASASMTVISANSQQFLMNRQLSRVRAYYESGGKFGASASKDVESGSDSDSQSDSSDESDVELDVGAISAGPARQLSEAGRIASNETDKTRVDATDEVAVTFRKLEEEVRCQRRLLRTSELEGFDFQWGMDPNGDFTLSDGSLIPCMKGLPGSKELITKELRFVKAETTKRADKLRNATDQHTGLEILHLFIIDLLGRNTSAARIFEIKSAEDFKYTKVVSKNTKRLAMLAILTLNAFFVYYAMLTGYQRGFSWQRVYLYACIVQFFVEIFLFETMECVWVNCAVPILVSAEVRQVSESIVAVVQELCAGATTTAVDARFFLNAPDYLFVSTNVAKKFPTLMESILVQAYCSHVPGELSKTWQVGSIARIQRHHRLRRTTLLSVMLGALQYMGTAPFIFHRMFVRAVQPFVLSALVLLWQLIIQDDISIAVTVVVVVILCVAAVYWRHVERNSLEQLAGNKVMVEYADGGADSTIVLTSEKSVVDDTPLNIPLESASDSAKVVKTTKRAQKKRDASVSTEGMDDVLRDHSLQDKELRTDMRSSLASFVSIASSNSHAQQNRVRKYSEHVTEDSISIYQRERVLSASAGGSEGSWSVSDSSVSSSDEDNSAVEVHVRPARVVQRQFK